MLSLWLLLLYDDYSDQAMILGKDWDLDNSEDMVEERSVEITKGRCVHVYILF